MNLWVITDGVGRYWDGQHGEWAPHIGRRSIYSDGGRANMKRGAAGMVFPDGGIWKEEGVQMGTCKICGKKRGHDLVEERDLRDNGRQTGLKFEDIPEAGE